MTQAGPLHWCTGAGWLVLAGGGKWQNGETGTIDAAALGWANLDRPIAVLLAAGGSTAEGEALLEYYADLGGPGGYVVPIFDAASAQQPENCQLLEQAGLVYIADGPDVLGLTRAMRESPSLEALERAFQYGAAVLGGGAGAIVLGAWVATRDHPERAEPGWGWLPDVIVEPHFVASRSAGRLHSLVNTHPTCLGLGIPERVALALGPDGRVETVGEEQITVVLSKIADEG
jgi:cyanophycinase